MQIQVTFYLVVRDGLFAEYLWEGERWVFTSRVPTEGSFIKEYADADDVAKRFGGKVVEVRVVTPNVLYTI